MRKVLISWVVAACAVLGSIQSADADNFNGRITLVQVTGNPGALRFFVSGGSGLSLFATGDYKEVLLQAFMHKAFVSLAYTPITCPGGITGICGNVVFVTVDSTNF